jgi:hypothetical protein
VKTPFSNPRIVWLLAIIGLLAAAFAAISSQSFWIDEAHTAWEAVQPTLPQWWREMVADHGSNLQMPLYMIYAWAWEKIFGHSEWWMRAANIPWLLLGLLAVGRRRPGLLVVAMASPFIWYCMDEARPYAMQIGTSLLVFAALGCLSDEHEAISPAKERLWVVLLACGLVLLSGSSLLGMVWAAAAVGAGLVGFPWKTSRGVVRSHWVVLLAAVPFLMGLAFYYLWTLRSGARAYSGALTDARNILFITYELLGFSGLGPGRFEIRTGGWAVFQAYLLPLVVYGGLLVAVLWAATKRILKTVPRKTLIGGGLVLGGAALFLLVVGYMQHFRVLGRHFAPLLVVVLWSIGAGLSELWERRLLLARVLAVGFVVASLASCVSLRLASRHAKDDYRQAAAVARAALARGAVVWWNADKVAGQFYGVRLDEPTGATAQGGAWLITNCTREALDRRPVPQLIVSSKADLYDATGALAGYVSRGGFKAAGDFPAFTLWTKSPN